MLDRMKKVVFRIREKKPLIFNLTNDVTMDFIANGLLSLGASPIMSKAQEEVHDLLQLADVVVINPGTLDEKFILLSEVVCKIANQLNKPVILDPVGAGASHYRTNANLNLIHNYDISIIRGNASEIISLSGETMKTKGVDSTVQSECAVESAQKISARYNIAVIVSGKLDLVVDGNNFRQLSYGSPLMSQITGTGCLLSAIVGAFHSAEKNRFEASILATSFYGLCGERAAMKAQGPGSFKMQFLDELNLFATDSL